MTDDRTRDILSRPWTAVPNDEIGGWAVSNDGRSPASGGVMAADLVWSQQVAEHIAALHNQALRDAGMPSASVVSAVRVLLDALRHQPGQTPDVRDAVSMLGRALDRHDTATLRTTARQPWEIRAAATGGGPCDRCEKPFYTHVCLGCSPDYQTPGPGCHNCRNTGMDQTPCLPPTNQNGVRR